MVVLVIVDLTVVVGPLTIQPQAEDIALHPYIASAPGAFAHKTAALAAGDGVALLSICAAAVTAAASLLCTAA